MKLLSDWKSESTFCIHLGRSHQRLEQFDREMSRIGRKYTIWPATDGKMLPPHPYLTPGQLGCFESHRALWRQALRMGLDEIIIFEDDIVFSDNFPAEVDAFMSEDSKERQIVRLNYSGVGCSAWGGKEFSRTEGNAKVLGAPLFNAAAYILKVNAILSLAATDTPIEADYALFGQLPIQESQDRNQWAPIHSIPNFVPFDNICWQSGGFSEITGEMVDWPRNQRLSHLNLK
jgi:Glycosyltransferase family 25 (LPS biosynthesis protein)